MPPVHQDVTNEIEGYAQLRQCDVDPFWDNRGS